MNFVKMLLVSILVLVILIICYNRNIDKYKFYQNFLNTRKIPEIPELKIDENIRNKPFPKNIIRTWCNNNLETTCGGRESSKNPYETTQNNMEGWEQKIYTDEEIEEFIIKEFGENSKIYQAYLLINPKYSASRSDLARLLLIFVHGGIYLDMKSCIHKQYLPEIPDDKDLWVSNWKHIIKPNSHLFKNGEYQNWYIYGRPRSKILKSIIEYIIDNIFLQHDGIYNFDFKNLVNLHKSYSKSRVLSTTGPIALTNAINISKHKDDVLIDNTINKYLKYYCERVNNNLIDSKAHYSGVKSQYILKKFNIKPNLYIFEFDNKENLEEGKYLDYNILYINEKLFSNLINRIYNINNVKQKHYVKYKNKLLRLFEGYVINENGEIEEIENSNDLL